MMKFSLIVASVAFTASVNAVMFMNVEKTDGTTVRYEVDNVEEVYFTDSTTTITNDGEIDGFAYVDLGLPSGLKWAMFNIGATNALEVGDFFAWGETEPKKDYTRDSYIWVAENSTFSKYFGGEVLDPDLTLEKEDDAATVLWGDSWRMPTKKELDELAKNCDWTFTNDYNELGISGYVGISKLNGEVIFFPSCGYMYKDTQSRAADSYIWSSTVTATGKQAYVSINATIVKLNYRYYGANIRPVSMGKK